MATLRTKWALGRREESFNYQMALLIRKNPRLLPHPCEAQENKPYSGEGHLRLKQDKNKLLLKKWQARVLKSPNI